MIPLIAAIVIAGTAGPEVALQPGPVSVPSRFVRLEQIAETEGCEGRLKRLVILTLEGDTAFVTLQMVSNRLAACGASADVTGPAYVQVRLEGAAERIGREETRRVTENPGRSALETLREAARSGLETQSERVHLRLETINSWGDDGAANPESLTDFRVQADGGGSGVRWVRFSARDAAGRNVHGWARYAVEERFQAVVARVPIRRGELLTDDKVDVRRVTLPFGRFDGFESLEAVRGRHAARDVRSGAVLQTADVKRQLAVRRGSVLTAKFNGAAFQLSDRVMAMKDAEEGEVIKVKNCRSGSVFRARVISRHTVVPVE